MASGEDEPLSRLTGEVLEKAKLELKEDPNRREEFIRELRNKIEEVETSGDPELKGVVFERKDSAFLLRFLRARKFDVSRAVSLYTNYYQNRVTYSKVFEEFTAQSCEELLRSGIIHVLEHRMRSGPKVIVFTPGKLDMDIIPQYLLMRSILIVLEKLLEDEETQVHGIAIFERMEDFTFMKMIRFTQSDLARKGDGLKILQDGFPARVKGFHMIEPPWYISIVLTLVRPFMKEKLRQRIFQHSASDWSSLHELMPPEHLPEELGGLLPPLDTFRADKLFAQELNHQDQP